MAKMYGVEGNLKEKPFDKFVKNKKEYELKE